MNMILKFRNAILSATVFISLLAPSYLNPACAESFTTFDAPGSSRITNVLGINDNGQTVGDFVDSSGIYHAFLRNSDGTFTTFDIPGGSNPTPIGINSSGVIAGTYNQNGGHGFIRAVDGTITSFDAPNAEAPYPRSVNAAGQIAGYFYDGNTTHGFLRDTDGTISTLDDPLGTATYARSINDSGTVAGYYLGPPGNGFIFSGGTFTTISVPGASDTEAFVIDANGSVAGNYRVVGSRGRRPAFLYTSDGTYSTFDPCAPFRRRAFDRANPVGISNGVIIGTCGGADPFVRSTDGTITYFQAPRSTSRSTRVSGVNSSGVIVGSYYERRTRLIRGYIRYP